SSSARYDLTSSGLPYFPLRDLPVRLRELELSGTGAYGYEPLQRAIAGRYGVPVECIVPAMGTSMANHLVMAALLEPGDEALVEFPTYEPLLAVAGYLRAGVRRFVRRREDGFGVDPAEVERQAGPRTRLIVLTNPHNPTSALAEERALREVGEVAQRVGARVLVDEVYLDAVFAGAPPTAFSLGDHFVVTNSLTKVYGLNGLRCGWIFAEPALAQRLWRLNELFSNIGVHAAELLSVAAFRHLDHIAARSRGVLDANRAALDAFFRSRADLEWLEHRFGTVSFPRLPGGGVDRMCTRLKDRYETSVVPGRFFGMADHFRVGLGTEPATFAAGLERLGRALDETAA
ncbi:MAG TPA: pyridoxal phosphate-dependent aminotransferase, partial [Longimicrobiaceae bacterium]|nr:pyridoxal phosphate-dependent aminotransferase [Longimicrobiaceae bacterium]